MNQTQLEAGKIVNTHGVRGELKLQSWLDSPALFAKLHTLYVNGTAYPIRSARVHGAFALVMLEGINSIDDAMPLKNKVALVDRTELPLAEGCHFIADLIGMKAVNAETGDTFGTVSDVLEYPAQDLYQVAGDDGRTYLIPDVPAFVHGIDDDAQTITFTVLEGMGL